MSTRPLGIGGAAPPTRPFFTQMFDRPVKSARDHAADVVYVILTAKASSRSPLTTSSDSLAERHGLTDSHAAIPASLIGHCAGAVQPNALKPIGPSTSPHVTGRGCGEAVQTPAQRAGPSTRSWTSSRPIKRAAEALSRDRVELHSEVGAGPGQQLGLIVVELETLLVAIPRLAEPGKAAHPAAVFGRGDAHGVDEQLLRLCRLVDEAVVVDAYPPLIAEVVGVEEDPAGSEDIVERHLPKEGRVILIVCELVDHALGEDALRSRGITEGGEMTVLPRKRSLDGVVEVPQRHSRSGLEVDTAAAGGQLFYG